MEKSRNMHFQVVDMDLTTGGIPIAILNERDSKRLDLRSGDRVIVKFKKKETTCVLNISENEKAIPLGKIGLFEEVLDALKVKKKNLVELKLTGKPESVKHIRDKVEGKRLNDKELFHIIKDFTEDKLTDIEKTYFVASGATHGFSNKEIVGLIKAMVNTGRILSFKKFTVDKHCIGGVPGNRTTMIVVPILAAAGLTIPKTSSRAITSPAGTADTMECLANVELSEKKIKKVVKDTGGCMVHGGSINLSPSDDKIIEIEHPISIDAEGQLIASVIAKKKSVSANQVLIDIPMGKGSKVDSLKKAKLLKKKFINIGKKIGMNIKVIITDGTQPIGNGVGPLLESEDVMSVLRNDPLAPTDLRDKSLKMATIMLKMSGKFKNCKKIAKNILNSGEALKKMQQIIKAQGKKKKVPLANYRHKVLSNKKGRVLEIDNKVISKVARIAGAPINKGSGLFIHKKVKDPVMKKEVLYTIYAESKFKMDLAKQFIKNNKGYKIS